MTMNDLEDYRTLRGEIKELIREINEVTYCSVGSPKLSGMPTGKGNSVSSVEKTVQKKIKLQEKLSKKLDSRLEKLIEIEDFLETVEDTDVRLIIRYRFINGLDWQVVGEKMHFERTTPYYKLKKYLEREASK